ncbi:MAG: alpha/beta fold hydrolase [Vicinamibacteria bacterium]
MTVRRRRAILLVLAASGAAAWLWCARPPGPTGAWMARAGVTERFLDAAGWRVRYVRAGSGPPVVLLHGLASSIYTWSETLPGLAARHDVVALDFPGFGGTETRPTLTADDLARVVPAVADGLGLGAYDLVGHSLGGAIAAVTAAAHPQRVRRLVLVDAAGFNLAASDRPAVVRALGTVPPAVFELLPLRRPATALGLRQVFHDGRLLTRERVDEYLAPMARPGTAAALRSLLTSRDGLDVPAEVARIRQPTLVIWGRDDRWIDVSHAARFAAAIPGARTALLDGCGHMPQEERPADFVRLVLAFLDGDAS